MTPYDVYTGRYLKIIRSIREAKKWDIKVEKGP